MGDRGGLLGVGSQRGHSRLIRQKQHPTQPHASTAPQQRQRCHRNRRSVKRSLGNHRRVQNPYSDSNQKRRSPKRHMGRDRPHHGHMGDTRRTDQNRSPASGSSKQPGTEHIDNAAHLTDTTGLVFPSPTGKPQSNSTISKLVRENRIEAVPHGMRSSFRDWCRDSGVPREIAEAALAHIVRGVEGAYARSDLLEARRPIMEKWAPTLRRD